MSFDRVIALDWSAAGRPRSGADSIWLAELAVDGAAPQLENLPTRSAAHARLLTAVQTACARGERLLIGADFAFGFPAGLAERVTGAPDALGLWAWLGAAITEDARNRNNHRDVAARINALLPGDGPFWGNAARRDSPGLPRRRPALPAGLSPLRRTEEVAADEGLRPKSVWQLAGAGAVGAQSLTGVAMLSRLRAAWPGQVAAWPLEPIDQASVVLAEIYPAMLRSEVAAEEAAQRERGGAAVRDAVQMQVMARALGGLARGPALAELLAPPDSPALLAQEGWILGAGTQTRLRAALPAQRDPPRLRDDCFAMPQGVRWVPVDTALERLRAALHPVAGTHSLPTAEADGHVLAQDVLAARSHPPAPNSAVDGYGFAQAATGAGPQRLPLVEGRAAAGQPYRARVPAGTAIRILTGASLPDGVDSVILEEDTAPDGAAIVFDGPVRRGANTREAGEDIAAGGPALPAGRRLTPPDLALLSALGVGEVTVHRRLRVAVLSTGDELAATPAADTAPERIHDANRPMLLALVARWGFAAVDLGCQPDDPKAIAAALDRGAASADVVLVSGGASAGDEDHVSRLLRTHGNLSSWRIALKPGRPLALAMWNGTPVFGLPGNPVAAFVCALVFARPALWLLAGAGWTVARGVDVPAAFSKDKKPGRREYLRARLDAQGRAEVFASEGSGRISGLSWATGLVELPDAACMVTPGTPVRFLPFAELGIA